MECLSKYFFFPSPCTCIYMWVHTHPSISSLLPSSTQYRTICTVPIIDVINGNTYEIVPQGGGDEDGYARGAWDWSMLWKRVPLTPQEKRMRKTKTEPYR